MLRWYKKCIKIDKIIRIFIIDFFYSYCYNVYNLSGNVIWRVPMKKMVLSILADNTPGVLSRVSGLFSRRGYNIDSITAGVTQNSAYSRMTVVVNGDDQILEQIRNQLLKLEDIREVRELLPDESVCRELILVKVLSGVEDRQAIIAIADIFRAKIVDVAIDSLMIELTGNKNKIDAFISLLEGFTIKELVRTGITGLTRGAGDIAEYLDD